MANETMRLWELLTNRVTSTRAGYLDELDFDLDGRLGAPTGASLAADLATIDGVVDTVNTNVGDPSADTLTSIAAKLGNPGQDLSTMVGYEGATSLADKLTATRAGYLDELDFGLDERLGTPAGASLAADLATIDGVVDTVNTNVGDPSADTLTTVTAKLGNPTNAIGSLLEDATYGLSALDSELGTIRQKATSPSWDQDTDSLEAIREAIDALTEKGLNYGSAISGSVTPADATENILVETDGTGDYAQDFELFLSVDLSVMAAGDTVEIKVYKRVDGTNYILADSQSFSDAQTIQAWEMDAIWGDEVQDLKVTLAQTAGTYRTFNYRGAVRKPA